MDRIFEAMSTAPEQSFADFIHSAHASDGVKRAATSYIEGFNAADRNQVSVEWLNSETAGSDEIQGDRLFRVLSGYDAVAQHLARGLDLALSSEARRIRWTPGDVRVETATSKFRASAAVVAVPFAVLERERLQIEPEPRNLNAARDAIATGNAIRITFRFEKAPWADAAPQLSFLHGEADFPVWWTAWPVRTPVITGWAAGPKADALAGQSQEQLRSVALESLAHLLGKDPGEPQAAWLHDWANDPFALGAYTYVRVNGMRAHERLRDLIEDTICFAGEALATAHMGTVHGAIASGIEAARKIVAALR
jgi:monoamine oxidase